MRPTRTPSRARVAVAASALAGAILLGAAGPIAPSETGAGSAAASTGLSTPRAHQPGHRPARFEARYFRPVLVDGMAFPVVRTNFLSLLDFEDSWHAPRMRLIGGKWRLVGYHEGTDITAERGTPVVSMTDGVIEAVGWTFYSGTRIGVRGTDGRYYLYAHLDAVRPGIAPGVAVAAGSILGRLGNTGYGEDPGHRDEFPPHLHFGIEGPAGWVNPYPALRSLYRATVQAHRNAEAELRRLFEKGDRAAWEARIGEVFMSPEAADGE